MPAKKSKKEKKKKKKKDEEVEQSDEPEGEQMDTSAAVRNRPFHGFQRHLGLARHALSGFPE